MKKTIIIFIVILFGLFAFLSYVDRKGDYIVQKQLWNINQRFVRITKDPKAIPDAEYDDMAEEYRRFIKQFPDSRLVSAAYILMGRVYVTKTDYKKARDVFEETIKKFPDDARIGIQALTEIGRTYAIEKDEKNILATYKRALDEYPLTDLGMGAPLIIAKFYIDKGQKEEGTEAFKDAIVHYKKLISEYPDSVIDFHAKRLLAACYMAQEKWDESIKVFSDILLKFANQKYFTPNIGNSVLKSINTISVVKLNSVDKPIEIYTKFIEQYPDHPFNKVLPLMISTFKELKQKVEASKAAEAGSAKEAPTTENKLEELKIEKEKSVEVGQEQIIDKK